SRGTPPASTARCGARAPGRPRRECRRTWSSRADRSRSNTCAVGCRIASVLLLRDMRISPATAYSQRVGAGGGLYKNHANGADAPADQGAAARGSFTTLAGQTLPTSHTQGETREEFW